MAVGPTSQPRSSCFTLRLLGKQKSTKSKRQSTVHPVGDLTAHPAPAAEQPRGDSRNGAARAGRGQVAGVEIYTATAAPAVTVSHSHRAQNDRPEADDGRRVQYAQDLAAAPLERSLERAERSLVAAAVAGAASTSPCESSAGTPGPQVAAGIRLKLHRVEEEPSSSDAPDAVPQGSNGEHPKYLVARSSSSDFCDDTRSMQSSRRPSLTGGRSYEKVRREGQELYRRKEYAAAAESYGEAMLALLREAGRDDATKRSLQAVLLANRAMCFRYLGRSVLPIPLRWRFDLSHKVFSSTLGSFSHTSRLISSPKFPSWPCDFPHASRRNEEAIRDCHAALASDFCAGQTLLHIEEVLEECGDLRGALACHVASVQRALDERPSGEIPKEEATEVERVRRQLIGERELAIQWKKVPAKGKPPLGAQMSAVEWRGQVILFGGTDRSHNLLPNDLHIFDTYKSEWLLVHIPGLRPAARAGHRAVVHGDCMYVCGGGHSTDFDMWRLDLVTMDWEPVPAAPGLPAGSTEDESEQRSDEHPANLAGRDLAPRGQAPPGLVQHSVCVVDGRLLVWGGFVVGRPPLERHANRQHLYEFDFETGEWRRDTWQGDYLPKAYQDRGVGTCAGVASCREGGRSESVEIMSFFGSRKTLVPRSGLIMDESIATVDRLLLGERRWQPVPLLGPRVPAARSEAAFLSLPDYAATLCVGGYYEGAIHRDGCRYYGDAWLWHHDLGIWSPLAAKGDDFRAGAHFWLVQRADGAVFAGGGFCGTPITTMFGTVYEATIVAPKVRCPPPPRAPARSLPLAHPIAPGSPLLALPAPPSAAPILALPWGSSPSPGRGTSVSSSPSPPPHSSPRPLSACSSSSSLRTPGTPLMPIVRSASAAAFRQGARAGAHGEGEKLGAAGGMVVMSRCNTLPAQYSPPSGGMAGGEGGVSAGGGFSAWDERQLALGSADVSTEHHDANVRFKAKEEAPYEPPLGPVNIKILKLEFERRRENRLKTKAEMAAAGAMAAMRRVRAQQGDQMGAGVAQSLLLHVRMRQIDPPIWRRMEVSGHMTLRQFHKHVLRLSMGWARDHHAYKFRSSSGPCPGVWFGPTLSAAPDFALARMLGQGLADDNCVLLGEVLVKEGDRMAYVYDLTDRWEHEIVLLHCTPGPPHRPLRAEVVDGWGACPPEDVGGMGGYLRLLERVRSSHGSKRDAACTWVLKAANKSHLDSFDPTNFPLNACRAALEKHLASAALTPPSNHLDPRDTAKASVILEPARFSAAAFTPFKLGCRVDPFTRFGDTRPTWAPAKGGEEQGGSRMFGPSQKYSARDVASHTSLKPRKEGQVTKEEVKRRDLRGELEERERRHFAAKEKEHQLCTDDRKRTAGLLLPGSGALGGRKEVEERLIPRAADADDSDGEDRKGGGGDDEDESDDDEDDDEDDTMELLAELERIKKERAEEKLRKEKEQAEQEAKAREREMARGNPIMAAGGSAFAVKRRWDDDVVFRNQAKDEQKPTKRFINDTIRSDFHRRFLNKYMK
ncbi:unnamed protein product [Closterium sp. Yama58-4]|nr:unnamed protein product [Closterium sp. Yama58-4]